jgi:predicted nucleotidyltransferase
LERDENIISLALVGSYADGSYDEKSDLDFLVITPSRKNFADLGRKFEAEFGAGVNVTVFKLSQWRQLARSGDALYKKVVESHVLLCGGGLG